MRARHNAGRLACRPSARGRTGAVICTRLAHTFSLLAGGKARSGWTAAALLACLAAFAWLLVDSFNYAGRRFGPALRELEARSPE